ncbi:hypothetical protein PVAP13_4NG319500 [Panicum virgatum]|uniref:Uncharacterized protein n=1 Tax=Panicum virgatum TaxID=38727 RepID=A0A8T0TBR1_PANVG|nr:hypothetical protein PVAP13_4NG319500 [Panicum virgatum]
MGDHLKAHRPVSIEKIALPDKKKALFHAGAPSPGHHHHGGASSSSSHEAPAASITTPRTAAAPRSSSTCRGAGPRACLCSPTVHAGSFRCWLHRGIGSGAAACDRTAKLNGLIKRNGHHLNASGALA